MEKQMAELSLQKLPLPPPPPRPNLGTKGTKVVLRANYINVTKLVRYNFESLSPRGRKPSKTVRGKIFMEMIKQKLFGNCLPVYDGNDLIYCSTTLPMGNGKEDSVLEVVLPPSEDNNNRPTKFEVKIKSAKEINLRSLQDYIGSGKEPDVSDDDIQTCMNALNTYLNFKVRSVYLSVGRGIYPPVTDVQRILLGTGEELKKGFCQSLRIGWDRLLVNVDTSFGIFYPPGNVMDVIAGFLWCDKNDLRNGIKEQHRDHLNKILKGVKIYVLHRGDKKRKYTINGLTTTSADRTTFKIDDKDISVTKYFLDTYKKRLEFGKLPCIVDAKNCYLPLEVCEIIPDQPFKFTLSDDARAEMIKFTCIKPAERFKTINSSFNNFFRYDSDEFLKSINMNIDKILTGLFLGRVLPSVSMTFHKSSSPAVQFIEGGRWNLVKRKVLDGQTLFNWSVLVLSGDNTNVVGAFMRQLREVLNEKGMNIANDPQIVPWGHQRNIKEGLIQAIKVRKDQQKGPQLIIVIMKERSQLYGEIKRAGENDLGVRTQCMLAKHLRKRSNEQFCVNLGLKINAKLGGRNFTLTPGQMNFISSAPTMVFGADVFHSGKGEFHIPSIAAVCASMDANATIYSGRHSMQNEPRNETIENMEGMVVDLLKAFQAKNKCLPKRILFYRDGVSEGQFKKVIELEVEGALKRAFKRGYGNNPPKLTFIIVQKRHHTKIQPESPRDGDRNGNCKPGTVVDTGIVARHEFDFFLQSHATIQGTGRSAHYRVLRDDNGFGADDLQLLTNNLCYLNARCTSAISIVTPAFYAHLIANRARQYLTWDGQASRSSIEEKPSCPPVKKDIENIMYFI
ncbi:9989_t:CDS:10 [Funneliformis mosseae]|uniref:9989_t:CDS:1 n=1 Tax=Funneliformis mosseae TaxID=27381 RepID=A0A9N8YKU9_FUNMO|nr:9989_t:CDS:10 [Funneliformis mosseae]